MQWVQRLLQQSNISGKGAAFSAGSSGSPIEAPSSPSTFVERMKLYSINGPSAYPNFHFDFRIYSILALSRRRQMDRIDPDFVPRGKYIPPRQSC